MQLRQKVLKWNTSESKGEPLEAFGKHLVPIGRVLRVEWPGGEFVWHRPVAVEVQNENHVERLPIPNATRFSIGLIMLSGLIAVVVASLGKRVLTTVEQRRGLYDGHGDEGR